jgi:hypothetical protein
LFESDWNWAESGTSRGEKAEEAKLKLNRKTVESEICSSANINPAHSSSQFSLFLQDKIKLVELKVLNRGLFKHMLLVIGLELKDLLVVNDSQVPLEVAALVVRVFSFVRELESKLLGAERTFDFPDVLVDLDELDMRQIVLR